MTANDHGEGAPLSRAGSSVGDTMTVRVAGMTCGACERRVSAAIGALPGVSSVQVSAARGRATLTAEQLPTRDALDKAIRAAGYSPAAPQWINHEGAAWATVGLAVIGVGLIGGLLIALGVPDLIGSPTDGGGVAVALLVGLAAGFSTCMALVGGLVLALTASYGVRYPDRVATWQGRVRPQVAFNAGRIVGFGVGGAVLGMLGSAFELPTTALAVMVLVAATVMTILGVRLTGLSPRIAAWTPRLPGRWGDRVAGSGAGAYSDGRAALAGAATFVLPCGFTQAMQIYAVSTGSPAQAAAVMIAFAVGTTPGLFGLGVAAGIASARGGTVALRAVGVVVLAFALVTAAGSLRSLGLSLPSAGAEAPTSLSSNVTVVGGTQTVTMTQEDEGYSPADTTVYAGLPITWIIESASPYSCAAFLRVPSLDVRATLQAGPNRVDLPALDEGTVDFTCVMGMYGGRLTAIPQPATILRPVVDD